MVYDVTGQPVTLEQGVKVFDKDGNEVEYDGTSPLTMKQLVVDLPVQGLHLERWRAGQDRRTSSLAYKIDCDKTRARTGLS